ncbi:hypothetical protein DL766_009292 [Monosporascus sp. MC13-8B]|uniref:DUF7357 domain-containing protein n=1 Tax=Monosporascus cannonballus TaxID=155416 RepID=A0ABY0HD81_9PEZI|nr:hypothetical protein DL762_002534 [Monosporascus cannonballus]RYO97920.1 hypothetical protein DL763_002520 [Monosporascus cannonballus]RYP15868.1 hypothetical protein DL766_009292 [Monosporascus sp. MC13-8B]
MTDKYIRLRLVVQRNGLPEDRFMLPLSLENDPTVAKLLEHVHSNYFPLESGQWGLEDYAVYRQSSDGTRFECLHFSAVRTLFRDDDQALICPLQTDDLRRRRISGRYQISSDGKHLVDGVPFGRPLLRAPAARPPIHIPPRKKRRLLYDQDEPACHDEGGLPRDDDSVGENDDAPMLLLTDCRARGDGSDSRRGRMSNNPDDAHPGPDTDEEEEDDDDGEFEADESQSSDVEDDDNVDEASELEADDELARELEDLRDANATIDERSHDEDAAAATSSCHQDSNLESPDKISVLHTAFPSAPPAICETVLMASNGDIKEAYATLSDGFPPQMSDTATLARLRSGATKQTPAPHKRTAGDITAANTIAANTTGANATALALANKKLFDSKDDDGDLQEDDKVEEISAFVREFDHRGLPPGSIFSGKGLSRMATLSGSFTNSKLSGDSEATSTTLIGSNGGKPSPQKIVTGEEDDDTSSSGTSSSSEEEDSEDFEDSEDDDDDGESSEEEAESDTSSADEDSDSGGGPAQADLSNNADTENDSSNNSSSDEDDSGPEEVSTRRAFHKSQSRGGGKDLTGRGSEARSDSSSSDSSSSDETSSDDTSDDESSEAESSSNPQSGDDQTIPKKASTLGQSSASAPERQTIQTLTSKPQPAPVPPGQGKESTRSRNARRRAALKAKKLTQAQVQARTAQTAVLAAEDCPLSALNAPDKNAAELKSLFEAKRKALLHAIASDGLEVDSKDELVHESDSITNAQMGSKRKRDRAEESTAQDQIPQDTPISEATSVQSDASQKRRRLDVGAGRRLLFGALGLRNPKGKDDADKVRAKLMEGVRSLANHRFEQDNSSSNQPGASFGGSAEEEEDPDSWRDRIVYRAVECSQERVELSEPPFPFVQRWDPQQQGSGFHKNSNKRGGQGKRAERNQAHFYQGDSHSGKKRKQGGSSEWGGEGYDETFNGIEGRTGGDDIQLNYDDIIEPCQAMNVPVAEASQFTDMDDLPSLPEDLAGLPNLRPGDVKPGMVITWKKWSCSEATGWQPQISDVTGVVVRIDDDATALEVCLAKRDRNLDDSQKRYDSLTGQRIYGKFEAPDLDEDDGDEAQEDEGYRTLSLAEMQEPRILQQPLPSVEGDKSAEVTSNDQHPNSDISDMSKRSNKEVSAQPQEASHVAESSFLAVGGSDDIHAGVASSPEPFSELAKGDEARTSSNLTDHQPGQGKEPVGLHMSRISSPSRQLYETTNQVADFTCNHPSTIESSGYRGDVDTEAIDTAPLLSDSAEPGDLSSVPLFGGDEDEVITGTPRATYAKPTVPSSAGSVRSGRQPDYIMDNTNEPDSLRVTEADDEVHGVSVVLGAHDDDDEDIPTPTPSPVKASSSTVDSNVTSPKTREQSSRDPPTPGSIVSINTIFCTAKSSRQTESPLKSQSQSQQLAAKKPSDASNAAPEGLEYEEAMRKLDQQSDGNQDEEATSRIPDRFPRVDHDDSQPGLNGVVKSEESSLPGPRRQPTATMAGISPPPPKRAGRRRLENRPRESSQFSLPPGTQIIELLSSSDAEAEPEPAFAENYADDIDKTYDPKSSSLPKGPGWIGKSSSTSNRLRNTRSLTAPLGSRGGQAGQVLSMSQSQSGSSFEVLSSSLPELGREAAGGRMHRKTSAGF